MVVPGEKLEKTVSTFVLTVDFWVVPICTIENADGIFCTTCSTICEGEVVVTKPHCIYLADETGWGCPVKRAQSYSCEGSATYSAKKSLVMRVTER